jgi:hypothetical protein
MYCFVRPFNKNVYKYYSTLDFLGLVVFTLTHNHHHHSLTLLYVAISVTFSFITNFFAFLSLSHLKL